MALVAATADGQIFGQTLQETEDKGFDPEVDSFSTIGDYPNTRQYSVGIQLTF